MRALDLIAAKRDGRALSGEAWHWLIDAYGDGRVAEEQMSALLMAVVFQGLAFEETLALTLAMRDSGSVLRLPGVGRPLVDKHSTGGVGDKVTLVLAPLAAACGLAVAKLSGRGLGHTGGTLDKLESIPGYRTELSTDQLVAQVRAVHLAVAAAGEDLAPADRRLYALRDATGTVRQSGLIAASIMSKKLAVETDALVLDVKVGDGAFFATLREADAFAAQALAIGAGAGRRVRAILTAMDRPLGQEVGNLREVAEAVAVLGGDGPADVAEVAIDLVAHLLEMTGQAAHLSAGREAGRRALASGRGRECFEAWIRAQGGDLAAWRRRLGAAAGAEGVLGAPLTGVVGRISALDIGRAAALAGAGRSRKEDAVDPLAGISLRVSVGDRVAEGEDLAVVRASDPARLEAALAEAARAFTIGDRPPDVTPPVMAVRRQEREEMAR